MSSAPPGAAAWVRHLPNAITLVRFALVIPSGWLLWHGQATEALVLIAVAGISDAVDGELARRFDWRSRFGAIADPAADKLLSLVVFVILAVQGHLPLWLLLIIVGRDLVIVGGALVYRLVLGRFDVQPTLLSKMNTSVQIVAVLLVIVGLTGLDPAAALAASAMAPYGFVVAGAFGVVSGVHYILLWSLKARAEFRRRDAQRSSPRPPPPDQQPPQEESA